MKKVLIVLLSVAAIGATFQWLGLRDHFFGRKRFRFIYASQATSAEELSAVKRPPWRLEAREPSPQVSIQVALAPSPNSGAPWLVYFPGNDKTQLSTGIQLLEAVRGAREANLLVLSYRGYSNSTGKPRVSTIRQDCLSILREMLDDGHVPAERLHVIGFSIGAYFAAAATSELAKAETRPASLTLLAPAYDLVMVRPSFFDRIDPGDDYQMAPFLDSIQSRSLVVQGTADEAFEGPLQGRAASARLASRGGTYRELEGVGHAAILESPDALALVREFVWR